MSLPVTLSLRIVCTVLAFVFDQVHSVASALIDVGISPPALYACLRSLYTLTDLLDVSVMSRYRLAAM